ncbi:hypothetical protein [Ammoniphilus sp. 3BR4]|uniref:hypothetical protein n=1 Tax=Ammoniphilus sp. 3BR4 TaxID=3158265 RepID=UPI0034664377
MKQDLYLLPQDMFVQMANHLSMKPHHLEYKLGVLLILGFFFCMVLTTIRLTFHSWSRKKTY